MNSNKSSEGRHSSKEKKSSSSASETKTPLRTFGEWSEFMSSTGKIYFYNSKTEKAQWDKPDEWDYLAMEDRAGSKTDRAYYPPKEYKRGYRSGKYENEAYDYGSPNVNKPHRFSGGGEYKGYSREYSSEYMMPQSTYRQSSSSSYYGGGGGGDHHRPPSYHMPDYYESGPPSNSSSNDYYASGMQASSGAGAYSRGYGPSKEQDKYWNEQSRGNKSRGAYSSKSSREDKDEMRYSAYSNGGPYEAEGKGYASAAYHKHTSRFDSYNENSNPGRSDETPRASNYPSESAASDYSRSYKNSRSGGGGGGDYYDYYDQPPPPLPPASRAPNTRPYSRASSSSSSGSASYSRNSRKRMKRYDENRSDYARSRSSISPSKKDKSNERDSVNREPSPVPSTSTGEVKPEPEPSEAEVGSTEPTTSSKASTQPAVSTTGHVDESKEVPASTQPAPVRVAMPLLETSVEDINKYYKPELAMRFIADLGAQENINWINQPFTKQLAFSKSAVELKNFRSLVRINEIKKTLLEQRLLFLQTQMKEIEEYLN